MDRIIDEMRNMKPDWAGPNTKAPPTWIVENVRIVAERDLLGTRDPDDVEVDPDDGTVAMHWNHKDNGQSFALLFQTRSTIIGVLTDLFNKTGYPPWRLHIEDCNSIREKLDHPIIKILTTNTEHQRSK